MGNCYSPNHIAEDHIHTGITCNSYELQQKYRLGTVSNRLLGGRGEGGALTCFTGSNPSHLVSAMVQTFGPQEGFLTRQ